MNSRTRVSAVRQGAVLGLVSLLSLADPLTLGAVDFIRGDVNGDGSVSIADAHSMLKYMFRVQGTIQCRDSMDFDDNGAADFVDGIFLLNWLTGSGPPPLPPFPDPGADANGTLGCEAYGGGTLLPDPAAELRVLDAVVAGASEGTARITLTYSSSTPLAGLSGAIDDGPQVFFHPENPLLKKPSGEGEFVEADYRLARLDVGGLRFGTLINVMGDEPPFSAPAGEELVVFTFEVCIKPGTPAGEYPLTLSTGELVDEATGRTIPPALVGGTLTVLSAVGEPECAIPPPQSIPVDVTFTLRDATGSPGGVVEVPFFLHATSEPGGFAFCVDFDETLLRGEAIDQVWRRPSGEDYDFLRFAIDNDDANPGSGGVDEGFMVGAAVVSTKEPIETLPRDQELEIARLRFTVRPDAPNTDTELRFLDRSGLPPDGKPVGRAVNFVTVKVGDKWTAADLHLANSFVLLNSRINIVPDGTPFVRGDSNDDLLVDLSDPAFTLAYLFLAGPAARCVDAADANDDGTLDLTDPIAVLSSLFLGAGPLPAPYPVAGRDATADGLPCPPRV